LQVRKDQNIGRPATLEPGAFDCRDRGHERGVSLQLAIDLDLWRARADCAHRFDYLINQTMARTAFG